MDLAELNSVSTEKAASRFRDCCGSAAWAQEMAAARPFVNEASLLDQAEKIWWNLGPEDWLEAFASHPQIGAKIGDKKAAPKQQERSAEWSKGEQAGLDRTNDDTREQLAEANHLYQEKFGYIFIVCATGKSAEEMLEICRARLANSENEELPVAAEEQTKITELRLKKLLSD
ncbi:MAG TPA: 2-oxo-4-hydroxy-4-carboxy-5-ureidoimidazoline decarboxylase [Pyrinomonadaceae bacterium]|jgi:allantoicase|nr:2-oxo-4-hydroxy-4-carboxy-5-ureidoimidazoline decarboxylase [Pyrinomonadaceae bacterium]